MNSELQPIIIEDSLGKRYAAKAGTNLVNAGLGLVTMSLVMRSLGPMAYGNFNFLTEFFNRVVGFLNMGTSHGFFTKVSQRPEEQKIIRFYASFLVLLLGIVIVFTSAVFLSGQESRLWPGQQPLFVYFALLFAFLTFVMQIVRKTNDAYGLTARTEKYLVLQKVVGLAIIVALFWVGALNLFTFFLHHFIILAFIIVVWIFFLHRQEVKPFTKVHKPTRPENKKYIKEFYTYSNPLFVYGLFGLISGIGDRWLLQTFAGSEQQGFYSLAYKVGALIFLFSGSMTPLFTREFSIAWKEKDYPRMRHLFRKLIPLFFFIASVLAVFVAIHGEQIGILLGGENYRHAGLSLSIMAFYPIHQTFGQLSGSVFFATGRTKLFRNIGVTMMIAGLVMTYFLLAPGAYGGFDLGANGLAVKMIIIQLIGVNIQLVFNTKLLQLSYLKFFLHQILVISSLSMLSYGSSVLLRYVFSSELLHIFASGVVYISLVALLVFTFPQLISHKRSDLVKYAQQLLKKISSR